MVFLFIYKKKILTSFKEGKQINIKYEMIKQLRMQDIILTYNQLGKNP